MQRTRSHDSAEQKAIVMLLGEASVLTSSAPGQVLSLDAGSNAIEGD
jgi:hypothetical protein